MMCSSIPATDVRIEMHQAICSFPRRGFRLKARWVMHAVGPQYYEKEECERTLKQMYR
jgi:hypothetical protein